MIIIKKICSLCGSEFQCHDGIFSCWCSKVKITKEYLGYLKTVSSDCVCPQCLLKGVSEL
ncbi:cysteine-rich CWC family protein [Cuniculiplasma sp. SKW4]|uniref:cysteine-rich CWC family protein n=1 Tax=Cuniculiplasma sp. SKW4 TaxID=3400171 RepID=UPI003FD072E4